MSDSTQHPQPTAAEQQMFRVHDAFDRLLERAPARAAQLATELVIVVQRYVEPARSIRGAHDVVSDRSPK